jgi:hypothetical protein
VLVPELLLALMVPLPAGVEVLAPGDVLEES